MAGFYLYITVALALIYPHLTERLDGKFHVGTYHVNKDLTDEKSFLEIGSKYHNVACDILKPYERQELCDIAIKHWVANEPELTRWGWNGDDRENSRNIRVVEFLDTESSLPVPPLARKMSGLKCERLYVREVEMRKRMYYCKNRVFKAVSADTGESIDRAEVEGFFITGSRMTLDTAMIFKPSQINPDHVRMTASITSMRLLDNAYYRCGRCH